MKKAILLCAMAGLVWLLPSTSATACTHITLTGTDGTCVSARTMEWGDFDLRMNLNIVPRETVLHSALLPDKKLGLEWKNKYGFVGINILGISLAGAMNEKGLNALMLYFPGSAEYQAYDPTLAADSITAADLVQWVVSNFETVDQVREALVSTQITSFSDPSVGGIVAMHWAIADSTGKQIVVEYIGGQLHLYEAPLGVLTNSPPYNWHLTNLRNYLNMRPVAWPNMKISGMDLKPIGAGSGMLGLPGDITPPSRFIRAVAFTQAARKTSGGYDTVREVFRILDNFNVPIDKETDPEKLKAEGLTPLQYGGTLYTSAWDMKNLLLYYHTDDDRSVRRVDLKKIDFTSENSPVIVPLRGNGSGVIDITSQLVAR